MVSGTIKRRENAISTLFNVPNPPLKINKVRENQYSRYCFSEQDEHEVFKKSG